MMILFIVAALVNVIICIKRYESAIERVKEVLGKHNSPL